MLLNIVFFFFFTDWAAVLAFVDSCSKSQIRFEISFWWRKHFVQKNKRRSLLQFHKQIQSEFFFSWLLFARVVSIGSPFLSFLFCSKSHWALFICWFRSLFWLQDVAHTNLSFTYFFSFLLYTKRVSQGTVWQHQPVFFFFSVTSRFGLVRFRSAAISKKKKGETIAVATCTIFERPYFLFFLPPFDRSGCLLWQPILLFFFFASLFLCEQFCCCYLSGWGDFSWRFKRQQIRKKKNSQGNQHQYHEPLLHEQLWGVALPRCWVVPAGRWQDDVMSTCRDSRRYGASARAAAERAEHAALVTEHAAARQQWTTLPSFAANPVASDACGDDAAGIHARVACWQASPLLAWRLRGKLPLQLAQPRCRDVQLRNLCLHHHRGWGLQRLHDAYTVAEVCRVTLAWRWLGTQSAEH